MGLRTVREEMGAHVKKLDAKLEKIILYLSKLPLGPVRPTQKEAQILAQESQNSLLPVKNTL